MTRHRFDVFSFLAGAIAVLVAALVLVDAVAVQLIDLRVVGPVVVLALGLSLLLGGGRDGEASAATTDGSATDGDGNAVADRTEATDGADAPDAVAAGGADDTGGGTDG